MSGTDGPPPAGQGAAMQPVRLSPDDDMAAVHRLLTDAFAYMAGRIDPPSSLDRMTAADLARAAQTGELWILPGAGTEPPPGAPLACMVLTPEPGRLYLGKLAVAGAARGSGLARRMIAHAVARARALGLPALTLQTRVELTGNHATFTRLGFIETGRTAHPGFDRPTSVTFTRPVFLPPDQP